MDIGRDSGYSPPSIRKATADDYADIAALWSAAGLAFSAQGRDGKQAFRRQLEHFGDLYMVATDAERIIGVVLGSHDHRKGWINRLAVLPEYRRRGIAEKLVTACEDAIRAQGIDIIATLVMPDNKSSCALFEKLGYRTDVPVRYFRKLSGPEA